MKKTMAAILIVALLSASVLAQSVPFKGTLEAREYQSGGSFPVFVQSLNATGHATHIGRFTMAAEWEVNVLTGDGTGSFTLVAANGDTLVGTSSAESMVRDGIAFLRETFVVTGGTGRFTHTTGTINAGRVLVIATGISASSFEGTIDLHD